MPLLAKALAVASPIPEAAPVMTATLPLAIAGMLHVDVPLR